MNSVAAVHHSATPPLMVQPPIDSKPRPSPITPVIQNTNQVIFENMQFKQKQYPLMHSIISY